MCVLVPKKGGAPCRIRAVLRGSRRSLLTDALADDPRRLCHVQSCTNARFVRFFPLSSLLSPGARDRGGEVDAGTRGGGGGGGTEEGGGGRRCEVRDKNAHQNRERRQNFAGMITHRHSINICDTLQSKEEEFLTTVGHG